MRKSLGAREWPLKIEGEEFTASGDQILMLVPDRRR